MTAATAPTAVSLDLARLDAALLRQRLSELVAAALAAVEAAHRGAGAPRALIGLVDELRELAPDQIDTILARQGAIPW